MTLTRRPTITFTAMIFTTIYTVVYLVGHSSCASTHPEVVAAASLFDLTITASVAFYFLLLRRGYSSWFTLTALAAFSLRVSEFLIPALGSQSSRLRWMSVPLELTLLVKVINRLRVRTEEQDTLTRIHFAAQAAIPYRRVANLVATELAVIYYAVFSWRAKAEERPEAIAFSYAEASGYSTLSLLFILGILCEGVPLHFVLIRFNVLVAWFWTALDLYALLWALALLRSVTLRTIMVDDTNLLIRIGFLSEAVIPVSDVASCQRISDAASSIKAPGYWRTTVLGDPQYLIELDRPATVVGLWGRRKQVTRIGIAIDGGVRFAALLNEKASLARSLS